MKYLLIVILLAPLNGLAQTVTGTIAGQIRGADGKPVPGVRVGATTVEEESLEPSLASIARTDEDGRFRLEGVPPGRYLILAGVLASPTYYPGTDEKASAKAVTVDARSVADGIDFSLVTTVIGMNNFVANGNIDDAGRSRFNGRFVFEDGCDPNTTVIARVRYRQSQSFSIVFPDGTFTIPVRVADFLSVEVHSASPFGNCYIKSMTYGRVDLLKSPFVAAGVSDQVVIALAPGKRISGVIQTETGSRANVTVYLISDVPITERPDLLRVATTDAEGRFEIKGIAPGDYRLSSQNDLEPGRATVAINGRQDSIEMRLIFGAGRSLTRVP